mmetsp:Transcript_8302/g.24902  ORF Transcript_8302/g.24902 Transcript_8302/m.24902 type:complete len:288 (+) Transcript_8302:989-1852(+)
MRPVPGAAAVPVPGAERPRAAGRRAAAPGALVRRGPRVAQPPGLSAGAALRPGRPRGSGRGPAARGQEGRPRGAGFGADAADRRLRARPARGLPRIPGGRPKHRAGLCEDRGRHVGHARGRGATQRRAEAEPGPQGAAGGEEPARVASAPEGERAPREGAAAAAARRAHGRRPRAVRRAAHRVVAGVARVPGPAGGRGAAARGVPLRGAPGLAGRLRRAARHRGPRRGRGAGRHRGRARGAAHGPGRARPRGPGPLRGDHGGAAGGPDQGLRGAPLLGPRPPAVPHL